MPGLWVEEAGPTDAPLVVLVHGSMDRASSFAKVVRRLEDVRTVVYDRRGYGQSVDVGPPFSMSAQVADLCDVMGDRPGVVIGHSHGGNVALAAAVARPDLVRAVGVFEPPMPWADWWPPTTGGGLVVQESATEDAGDIAERFMRRMIGDARWERMPPGFRADRRAEGAALVGELVDLRQHAAYDPAEVTVPVVAARGENGAEHHRRGAEALRASIPSPTMVTINGAGHGAHTTHPDEFAAMVRLLLATGG